MMANNKRGQQSFVLPQLPVITAPDALPDFSGRIRYRCRFDGRQHAVLDLGEVGQTVHAWLNGIDLGIRLCPPYRYDLTKALRDESNELVMEVSNTLSNAVDDRFSHYMAIPASGLLGPLRWMNPKETNA